MPTGGTPIRPRPVPLILLTALLALGVIAPAAARSDMILGVSVPGGRSEAAVEDGVNAFRETIGDPGPKPATWSLWSQWGSRGGQGTCTPGAGTCSFPSEGVAKLHELDITPVIWWEPINPDNVVGNFERYKRILGGHHDAYIEQWAQDARDAGEASGRRIILRFAHEPNGHWFAWGIGRFDNTAKNFKQAWRYVWRKFRDEGALPYVDFLWSVVKQDCPSCNPFAQVYPGGQYVDYAGVTAFNWGTWRNKRWKSMIKILEGSMRDLQRVTNRPIIVSELASHFRGGNKAAWIRRGYERVYDRWPRLKAILYLNTDEPHNNPNFRHPDWRLVRPNDGSALDAYADTVAKARFQGEFQ